VVTGLCQIFAQKRLVLLDERGRQALSAAEGEAGEQAPLADPA
jgi:hypothetical protein